MASNSPASNSPARQRLTLKAVRSPNRKQNSYTMAFKLEAIKFAEASNKSAAARQFGVDNKRIREWTKDKERITECAEGDKKRARVDGGGRRPMSRTLEERLLEWIDEMRMNHHCVSRSAVMMKAVDIFTDCSDVKGEANQDVFTASRGWLERFFRRNNITIRRRTTIAQKLPAQVIPKLEHFILYVRSLRHRNGYGPDGIIAMDETAVWYDMPSDRTVSRVGVASVPVRTTGHEKNRVTVVLAARASGKKLPPMIVFKGKIICILY